ncbi:conserved hypothetical protein [Acinetobacter baumannii]|nr:conserved hypothetical protein [Acinetobacter baumannii]
MVCLFHCRHGLKTIHKKQADKASRVKVTPSAVRIGKRTFAIAAPICTETKDKNAAANAMPCLEFVSIIIFTALGMIEILILYNQYISSIFHGKTIK